MDSFSLLPAKNGSLTCRYGGIFLHSSYNPEREAEHFVQELSADFTPACVLIIEPVLSYCLQPLRKRFPQAELACIRLTDSPLLKEYDSRWDYVYYASGDLSRDSEALYTHFGEEKLCALLAGAWQESSKLFPQKSLHAWEAIRASLVKSRNILYTRSFFAKRWLKNSIRMSYFLKKVGIPVTTRLPVIVAASGPSLQSSLPFLKNYRRHFFLLALSSAYLPLTEAGIEPNLTLTTDGGWWAKAHIGIPGRKLPACIAGAAEGALPCQAFSSAIIPLIYPDSPAEALYQSEQIPATPALRNGTVSGTALSFALSLTSSAVFFCGLDLAAAKGFQHTQPNALELKASFSDTRIKNAETRAAHGQFAGAGSLELYRSWFQNHTEGVKDRLFRLSASYPFSYALPPIKDVDWDFFRQYLSSTSCSEPSYRLQLRDSVPQRLFTAITETLSSKKWDAELFPLESILLQRSGSPEEAAAYEKRIAEGKEQLLVNLHAVYTADSSEEREMKCHAG